MSNGEEEPMAGGIKRGKEPRRTDQTSPISTPLTPSSRTLSRTLAEVLSRTKAALITLLVVVATLGILFLPTYPAIVNERLFDETLKTGESPNSSVSELIGRSGNYFQVTTPDKFSMVLGFVVKRLGTRADGSMDADILIAGASDIPDQNAWEIPFKITSDDSWKHLTIPKTLGTDRIWVAMGLAKISEPVSEQTPIVIMVECANHIALRAWNGDIKIQVTDRLGFWSFLGLESTATSSGPGKIVLSKPKEIAKTAACKLVENKSG